MNTKGTLFPEIAVNVLASAILTVAEKTDEIALTSSAPPSEAEEFNKHRDHMFDFLNLTFTGILRQYAPEIALRPSLTADAILRAENQILDEMDTPGGKVT